MHFGVSWHLTTILITEPPSPGFPCHTLSVVVRLLGTQVVGPGLGRRLMVRQEDGRNLTLKLNLSHCMELRAWSGVLEGTRHRMVLVGHFPPESALNHDNFPLAPATRRVFLCTPLFLQLHDPYLEPALGISNSIHGSVNNKK